MRVTYLKIPRKLHRFCKEKSCLNEVVTYYQLKIVQSNGYFKGTTIIQSMLDNNICNSESSCYYKLNKCIKLGVIEKTHSGYQIVSYDKMFEILGYEMSYNFKRKRKGFFKIFKVKESRVDRVREWIEYVDIRDSLKKQRILLFNSCRNNKSHSVSLNHYTESSCREYFEQFVSRDNVESYYRYVQDLHGYIYSVFTGREYKRDLNLDITLSLKGVCRVLGLTNVSSARKVLERLVKKGYLTVKKRLVETQSDFEGIYYKMIDGKKYANLSNKIDYLV